jgi:hypothetical protein
VTEPEFIAALKDIVDRCPLYAMEHDRAAGEIVLRLKERRRTSAGAQAMAKALKSLMSADRKKVGGGWV